MKKDFPGGQTEIRNENHWSRFQPKRCFKHFCRRLIERNLNFLLKKHQKIHQKKQR